MVQIGGRFQLIRNERFWEHLAALGIPEERAKVVDATKPILEVRIEGKDVTISTILDDSTVSSNFILNEEVDEKIVLNILLKSTITFNENQLKITSRGPNGETGTRIYDFTDTGIIMTLVAEDPNVPTAKRYYQRI
ncbi:fatty acid-binding protein, liver [Anoplophora glabripennis]|uniref:Fatty acid-binding protein, liver n=1 Tax=Anoplophora glabripennis TaxID=217634 RepID=V5H4N0_ANOGL|nr:fatty acid-binding protein, liver [Anoplophora glabripennis]